MSDSTEDTYPNQGRPSGWTPEDLVNKVTEIVSGVQTAVTLLRVELREEIARQGDIRRQQFTELRQHGDGRHDRHSTELSDLRGLVLEGQADIKKLRAGQDALIEGQAVHSTQINALGERVDELWTIVHDYMAGSMRDEVKQLIREFNERRGPDITQEQRKHYIDILMRMIAEYEAAHPDEAGRGDAE